MTEKQIFSFAASIPPFNMQNANLSLEWRNWSKQFQIFMIASNLVEQSDKRKVAILLHHMGPEPLDVFNSFAVDLESVKFDDLWKKFEAYFVPKTNLAIERHVFFTRKQTCDETIKQYATTLQNLSMTCEFGTLREDLVKDIFICGLSENFKQIKERLLSEGNIKWLKALEIAKSIEMAKESVAEINKDEHTVAVLRSKKQNFRRSTVSSSMHQKQKSAEKCGKCGQTHTYKCPAEGAICYLCKKPNHFAKMCLTNKRQPEYQQNVKNKYVRNVNEEQYENSAEEDGEDLFVGILKRSTKKDVVKEWNVEVELNGVNLSCQVDSGSQANLIPKGLLRKLNISNIISNVSNRIVTFSGEKLPVVGKVEINLKYENFQCKAKFYVLDMECKVVLSLDMAIKMNLINVVKCVNKENLIEKYSEVFDGLGLLKNACHLQLLENSQPVVDAPRRVPFSLLDPLRKELERMKKMKVIVEVHEPTEWVNSIVLVTKPNGALRLCLDPRNLNKVIVRPRYSFPTLDECKAQMCGSKIFSSLDANSGFWMIPLHEESSKLCTFGTPFGRYRFLRLPFGINAAPEIFHAEMVRLFADIKGLLIYMDDFLIHASSVEEHNQILSRVLERAKEVGLRFNKGKSNILKTKIKFIGHYFSENGVEPDDVKIASILQMPVPTNVQELQRFLGMVNYLGQFIENLSAKNKHLRDLLKNDTLWQWGAAQENEFNNLKKEITNAPVLTFYDTQKKLTLSVDASKFAMGAVIMHDKNPIAYASASLTDCQTNYAQIEKELFAILFGCTRFHQYIYGHNVMVETDHKPLVTLFNKPLHKIPARLQRFMLRLLAYDLTVVYKPGKYLHIADTLSRAPLKDHCLVEIDKDIELQCHAIISNTALPENDIARIKESVKEDVILQKIKNYLKVGWPENKKLCDKDVIPYFSIKDEIHFIEGLFFKNNRLIIPRTLRSEMLVKLHEGHLGVQRCQSLARSSIYWPNINNDIYNKVSACETCIRHRNANPKESLISHEIVQIPWYKVGSDLFEFEGKHYLLVVDYYSKYIEIENLNKGYSCQFVVDRMKSIFARHGIPTIMISDNGPPFNSNDFRKFCKDWGIDHQTSSPYLPRSNGLAERCIQTIKNIFKKCQGSGTDYYTSLLHYRTTRKNDLPSPAELLMSRNLRTKLPTMSESLKPKIINQDTQKSIDFERKIKQAQNYNKNTKNLKPITIGNKIYFKKNPLSVWHPGTIVDICSQPRSYLIKDEEGVSYRRNRQHILEISRKENDVPEISDIEKENCNHNTPEMYQEFSQDNDVQKSKSGRMIKPPKRLGFED